jgi:hypothetical protein
VAIVAVVLFAVSIWEIEMARFGRMYAPFQAIFAWYCIALYDAYSGSHRGFLIAVALATVSVFVYEGGALLLCASFIPLLAGQNYRSWSWPLAGASLLFGTWYLTADFTSESAIPKLPEGFNLPADSSLSMIAEMTAGPFGAYATNAFGSLMLASALLITLFFLKNNWRSIRSPERENTDWIAITWIALSAWLAAAGYFGIVLTLSLVLLLWRWLRLDHLRNRGTIAVAIWLVAALVLWATSLFLEFDGSLASRAKETVYALFLFPDLYTKVGYRWIRSLPFETLIAVACVPCYLFLTRSDDPKSDQVSLFRFLAGLFIVLAVAVAILPQKYATIRYTYFLHPIILVLLASTFGAFARRAFNNQAARDVMTISITAAFMIVGVDYNIRHMLQIDSPKVMFRTDMSKWDRDRVYRRWDYRSPAEFVNAHASVGDVILTTSQAVPFYLTTITHFYADSTDKEYPTIASCRGATERWSSADLLSNPVEFETLAEPLTNSNLWAIIRADGRPEASNFEKQFLAEYHDNVVYQSVDDRLVVVQISGDQIK